MSRRGWRDFDESDVRVRPGRGSRPRSKRRPDHSDATEAMVVGVDRGRWRCAVDGDPDQLVIAMRARELGRSPVVVGDRVGLVGDISGRADTLARIVRVTDRASVLRRTADDTDPHERIVVANAGQLIIVSSVADPPPRPGFIDRCLIAAYAGRLTPVLCLTKVDLADPAPWVRAYASLELPVLTSRWQTDPAEIRDRLTGQVSALVGHSGVGKSTVVNALVPAAERATGQVSGVGKGRHTSTSVVALPLPEGGWVIDTPGIRSLGLAHVTPDDLITSFTGFAEAAEECPPNCGHLGGDEDPDCHLDAFVSGEGGDAEKLVSLRRLLLSRAGRTDS